MRKQLLRNLEELADNIEKNAAEVREKITDEAVVISVSKYYSALKRLAEE